MIMALTNDMIIASTTDIIIVLTNDMVIASTNGEQIGEEIMNAFRIISNINTINVATADAASA
jgi:hypothetical protein